MDLSVFIQLMVLGLVRGSMYALMGVGLSLIFGIMEIVNFAHGELFMIGCYIMYFVTAMLGLPFPLGILASGIGLFIVGIMLEKGLISTLRKKAGREWLMDSFVLTIGLMVIFQNLALIIFGSIQRGIPNLVAGQMVIGNVVFIYDHLVILGLALLTVGLLWYFIKHTNLGKAIRRRFRRSSNGRGTLYPHLSRCPHGHAGTQTARGAKCRQRPQSQPDWQRPPPRHDRSL